MIRLRSVMSHWWLLMIKLNKNESPFPPFTKDELAEIIDRTEMHRYPREEHDTFIKLYADQYGFQEDQIALANGSDEWIQKLNIVLPPGKMLVTNPDFTMYDVYASQFKRPIVKVDCDEEFNVREDEILAAIKREKPIFFIFSQPNNPLGHLYSQAFVDEACELMGSLGGYCVVDEAYLQYSDASRRTVTELADHVVVLRTFSKIYGMAGLRIGIAISSPKTMELLRSVDHPYPVNSLSLELANAFLSEPERKRAFFAKHQALVLKLKDIFRRELDGVIKMKPTEANYIFTYGEEAVSLGDYLFANGFYPRVYDSERLRDVVRYSIASDDELDLLEQTIRTWKTEVI